MKEFQSDRPTREPLADGRHHLTTAGNFQSDKYGWCAAGFVPLKTSDPMAADLLFEYANRRKEIDEEFARDLLESLRRIHQDDDLVLETDHTHLLDTAVAVLSMVGRGGCWCEMAVGNPMAQEHSTNCRAAQGFMKSYAARRK